MFDIFKIGFLTITFLDVIDILIVAYIIYKVYNVIKGTIAAQIFLGLCEAETICGNPVGLDGRYS